MVVMYVSVVTRETVLIVLKFSSLNELDVAVAERMNSYMTVSKKDMDFRPLRKDMEGLHWRAVIFVW